MLNKRNNNEAILGAVFLTLLISIIQIHVLFAQKVSDREKVVENFLNELSNAQPLTDSVIQRYIINDGTERAINKIKEGLVVARTTFLNNQAERPTRFKIEALTIGSSEPDTSYYSVRLDNDHSLNFVVLKDKIKTILSNTQSSYNTTIFF